MDSEKITRLLKTLNQLEQKYGRVPAEADGNYDPSGETNARIHSLKDELAHMGVNLKWDGWQYEIDSQNKIEDES